MVKLKNQLTLKVSRMKGMSLVSMATIQMLSSRSLTFWHCQNVHFGNLEFPLGTVMIFLMFSILALVNF